MSGRHVESSQEWDQGNQNGDGYDNGSTGIRGCRGDGIKQTRYGSSYQDRQTSHGISADMLWRLNKLIVQEKRKMKGEKTITRRKHSFVVATIAATQKIK